MDEKQETAGREDRMTGSRSFTVFTPTYNRGHTLHRVFDSLAAQTYTDFEWLVIDDGSTDGTRNLVDAWRQKNVFPIQYDYQENSGKPRAFNRAVKKAKGRRFLNLDSDDSCTPDALEKFNAYWVSIPEEQRTAFSGITVHCMDSAGKIIGNMFPRDIMDMMPGEMNARHPIQGEKWCFYRTDVLRQYPYPEIPGERYIPEGVVWNRIGAAYRMRYVNETLRVYYRSTDGIMAQFRKPRVQSPIGARLYYREALSRPMRYKTRLRNLLNYIAFSFHAGVSVRALCEQSGSFFAAAGLLPLGFALYLRDKTLIELKPE
jgi:glycosyltransferase involved in cell wall biosynthesis